MEVHTKVSWQLSLLMLWKKRRILLQRNNFQNNASKQELKRVLNLSQPLRGNLLFLSLLCLIWWPDQKPVQSLGLPWLLLLIKTTETWDQDTQLMTCWNGLRKRLISFTKINKWEPAYTYSCLFSSCQLLYSLPNAWHRDAAWLQDSELLTLIFNYSTTQDKLRLFTRKTKKVQISLLTRSKRNLILDKWMKN